VKGFEARGVIFVDELEDVPEGAHAILSAHGVAPSVFEDAKKRSLNVIDATCPLVTKVHLEAHRFVREGYHIILIGHEGHDEVIGTMGQADGHVTLIEDEDQARSKPVPDDGKLVVLTQTTLGVDDTDGIRKVLKQRFPQLEMPPKDDICYATQNRQDAIKEMGQRGIDLLLVVGSPNSSNAARLVEVGKARGARSFLIDSADEILPEWLEGVESAAVSSGASTPEDVLEAVLARVRELGGGPVELITTVEEDVTFSIPPSLKRDVDAMRQAAGSGSLATGGDAE
ncbi:MAG: 4-hydroxy-3-methylbut-2-enyl diphosphate reductase, partial [Planctomycetes bacterium]|nr:4-hydroxy-3-methylbut-2-enyl diphosphate reductase [Planctomycetota bacterium]